MRSLFVYDFCTMLTVSSNVDFLAAGEFNEPLMHDELRYYFLISFNDLVLATTSDWTLVP